LGHWRKRALMHVLTATLRKGADDPVGSFPNLRRLFEVVDSRPAVARARDVGNGHLFKRVNDENTKLALLPSNYAPAA
jgi:GST-like protein